MPLFLSAIFLDFSQMLHTSEQWTMHLFSGWVGGRRSQRWDLKADDERGGKVLVTVNLEDHETRSGNRGCQVGVGGHRTRKRHITFYRWLLLCELSKCSWQLLSVSAKSITCFKYLKALEEHICWSSEKSTWSTGNFLFMAVGMAVKGFIYCISVKR